MPFDKKSEDRENVKAFGAQDENTESLLTVLRTEVVPTRFDDGFAERVMRRVSALPSSTNARYASGISYSFWRIAPLAAAAVLALATANIMNSQSATQPLIDRVLGLPAVTVAAAYTFDNVLDIEGR